MTMTGGEIMETTGNVVRDSRMITSLFGRVAEALSAIQYLADNGSTEAATAEERRQYGVLAARVLALRESTEVEVEVLTWGAL
jgi:hypothetical protein